MQAPQISCALTHLEKTVVLQCHAQDYLTEEIKHSGTYYELPILETIRRNFPRHGTIIDAGANIGNHAAFFGQYLTFDRLVCFEPFPDSCVLLKANVGHFAEIHQIALGDEPKCCGMTVYPGNLGMCDLVPDSPGEIEMRTLDSYNFESVTLIKIDVENTFMQMLKGALRTIQKYHPLLLIEGDFYEIFPILQGEGYACLAYWHMGSRNLLFKCLSRN